MYLAALISDFACIVWHLSAGSRPFCFVKAYIMSQKLTVSTVYGNVLVWMLLPKVPGSLDHPVNCVLLREDLGHELRTHPSGQVLMT